MCPTSPPALLPGDPSPTAAPSPARGSCIQMVPGHGVAGHKPAPIFPMGTPQCAHTGSLSRLPLRSTASICGCRWMQGSSGILPQAQTLSPAARLLPQRAGAPSPSAFPLSKIRSGMAFFPLGITSSPLRWSQLGLKSVIPGIQGAHHVVPAGAGSPVSLCQPLPSVCRRKRSTEPGTSLQPLPCHLPGIHGQGNRPRASEGTNRRVRRGRGERCQGQLRWPWGWRSAGRQHCPGASQAA